MRSTQNTIVPPTINHALQSAVGTFKKVSYPEVPPRVEYSLSEFGLKFVEILDQVAQLQSESLQSESEGR